MAVPACETWRKRAAFVLAAALAVSLAGAPVLLAAQEPAAAPATTADAHAGQPAAAEHGAEGAGHEESASPWGLVGKIVNFTLLVGTLVYFLRSPFAKYLASRGEEIRSDLATAARLKDEAGAQLAALDAKLKQLPHEIEALRDQGQEEVAAEAERLRHDASLERERLLDQTRREIDVQLRIAHRDLVTHAADLAVQVARQRVAERITDADQQRLVDRYLEQVKSV